MPIARVRSLRPIIAVCFCLLTYRSVAATSPIPNRITVAAFGDYGINAPSEAAVATMVKAWDPDFIITTGDNNYYDATFAGSGWEDVIGAYYGDFIQGRTDGRYANQRSATQRFFPAVGNHDVEGEGCVPNNPEPGEFAALGGLPPTGHQTGTIPGYLDYFHSDPVRPEGRLPLGTHTIAHSYYDF